MTSNTATAARSERVKFIYNAQFPADTAVVLNYLLNNPHFTGRQGRQKGMDAMMAFYRPLAEEARGELPEADLRDMARHCVAQLAQQIDLLCTRYQIEPPGQPVALSSTQGLEAVVKQGFQQLTEALAANGSVPTNPKDEEPIRERIAIWDLELADLAVESSDTQADQANRQAYLALAQQVMNEPGLDYETLCQRFAGNAWAAIRLDEAVVLRMLQAKRSPLAAARLILHGPLVRDLLHQKQFPQLALERYAAFTVRRAIYVGQPPCLYLDSD